MSGLLLLLVWKHLGANPVREGGVVDSGDGGEPSKTPQRADILKQAFVL